jgi:hypothetical protein
METTNTLKYQRARKRVKTIKEFYSHFLVYCLVIPFLWYLNYRTTDFLWAIFPTLGWGIGLAGHAMEAFDYNPLFGRKWEQRKIEELMKSDNF